MTGSPTLRLYFLDWIDFHCLSVLLLVAVAVIVAVVIVDFGGLLTYSSVSFDMQFCEILNLELSAMIFDICRRHSLGLHEILLLLLLVQKVTAAVAKRILQVPRVVTGGEFS